MSTKIKIKRTLQPNQVLGDASVIENGKVTFSFKTIELPWLNNQRRISCIPIGTYRVIKHKSPSFGNSFWVQDVPNRSEILIHVGNFAGSKNPRTGKSDLLGCIAPGDRFADLNNDGIQDVANSGNTMKHLWSILPNEFILEIS